jgi:crotonobetainyl-CoA:carnitine CoA-transferase CaiB-like acyl-CoA transferase
MSRTPAAARRRPPLLGEHNADVLEDWLGMPAPEIEDLSAKGVL